MKTPIRNGHAKILQNEAERTITMFEEEQLFAQSIRYILKLTSLDMICSI